MNTYEGIIATERIVSNLLLNCDFVEGLSLSLSSIKVEHRPIFWPISIKNKEASEKETYITFLITNCAPSKFSDGKCSMRKMSVLINLFSRTRNVYEHIEKMNEVFLENHWTFEMQNIDFDTGNQLFIFSFIVEALIGDD